MNGFQLKITIKGSKPPIWRRIVIPVKATFENLNDVIQEIFGWEHEHLWAFYIPELDIRFGPEMLDDAEDPGCTLRQVLEEGAKMRYVYDFGDSWEHSIVVEKLVENCEDCARVIKSKGAYMIEDCGGIWGYYDVIDEAQPFDMEAANAALACMPMGRFPKIALRLKDVLNHYKKEDLLQIAEIHNVRCFQGQNKPKIIELISERLLDEAYMKSLIENCTSDTLQLFEDAIEENLILPKISNNRTECACYITNDIGAYNSCGHFCRYCYANADRDVVKRNMQNHDPKSPLLIGHIQPGDTLHEPKQTSWIDPQMRLEQAIRGTVL